MMWALNLLVVVGLGGLLTPVAAQDKRVVAMIGTGTLAESLGPAKVRAVYPVVHGRPDNARASVRALVEKTGSNAFDVIQRGPRCRKGVGDKFRSLDDVLRDARQVDEGNPGHVPV